MWAVERLDLGVFIGFVGLSPATFQAAFTPAVEVGWRLAGEHWGHGFATEGAQAALSFGFSVMGLNEIVSFTTRSCAGTPTTTVMRSRRTASPPRRRSVATGCTRRTPRSSPPERHGQAGCWRSCGTPLARTTRGSRW